jgi:short-subunit dehydrogenase
MVQEPRLRLAFITGASSGLGRAFCLELDRRDDFDMFYLVSRRRDLLEELANNLRHPVRLFPGDVTDPAWQAELADDLADSSTRPLIKYLVQSAGMGRAGLAADLGQANADTVRLNCLALTQMIQLTLPYMDKGSHIFNIASVAAFMPQHGFASYAASKAYVLSYSRALHSELKAKGISCMAVCPNPMETEFLTKSGQSAQVKGFKRLGVESPENVCRKALRKLDRGKDVSLSNGAARLVLALSKLLPHRLVLWFERKFS